MLQLLRFASKKLGESKIFLLRNCLAMVMCAVRKELDMAKYQKKEFSPHLFHDWIHLFRTCTPEQRSELLLAIAEFPYYEPAIEVPIWAFIKSQLSNQYDALENKSQQMSENAKRKLTDINNGEQRLTEVNRSQPKPTEVNRSSQIEIETKNINKNINNNNNNIINNINKNKESVCSAHTRTHTRTNPPTLEEVFEFAKQMHESQGMGGFFCTRVMAEEFWSNYEANGWIIGNEHGTPIRDWKAKLRQWCLKEMRKPDKDGIPNCPVQAKGDR